MVLNSPPRDKVSFKVRRKVISKKIYSHSKRAPFEIKINGKPSRSSAEKIPTELFARLFARAYPGSRTAPFF